MRLTSLACTLVLASTAACGGNDTSPCPDSGPGASDAGSDAALLLLDGDTLSPDGDTPSPADAGTSLPVGSPCMSEAECLGETCYGEADGYPGGYCTDLGCSLGAPSNSCLIYGGDAYCLDFGVPGAPLGVCIDLC